MRGGQWPGSRAFKASAGVNEIGVNPALVSMRKGFEIPARDPLTPHARDKDVTMIAGAAKILTPAFPTRHAKADVQDALRQIPGGVGIVTGRTGAGFFATTATSIAPLSADPPTLILCLDERGAAARDDIGGLRRIGVSILGAQHRGLAEGFCGCRVPGNEAVCGGVAWRRLAEGAAVIEDAILAFDCRVIEVIERCGQAILIGEIEAMRASGDSSALVYWRGDYDRIGWTKAEIACATGSRG